MTTQADYRSDEWDLILGAPGLAALVIIQTEQCSQAVAYRKLRAVMEAIVETTDQGEGSALIQAVTEAVRAGQSPLWPTECPRNLGDIRQWALYRCQQVTALLAQRAPEAEADAYAHWLMRIAQRVALIPAGQVPEGRPRAPRGAWQRAGLEDLAAALDVPATNEARLRT